MTDREKASVGPRDLKTPGSVEWAWQTLSALKHSWEVKELSVQRFESLVEELEVKRAFELVPPGKPYGSLDAMLKAEIGETAATAREKVRRRQGRPKKDEKPLPSNDFAKQGNSADYLRARLERGRPDVLEALERGEFRSVRAAAIEAGIVKVPTPYETAVKAVGKLSKADKRRLASAMLDELGGEIE
jgi:hypothetical protein